MSNWLLAVSARYKGAWAFENWFVANAASGPEAFQRARAEIPDAAGRPCVLINAWDLGDAKVINCDGDDDAPAAFVGRSEA